MLMLLKAGVRPKLTQHSPIITKNNENTSTMNVSQYRQKIQVINENLIKWIEDILDSLDVEQLFKDQMYAGLDGDGKSLTPTYSQDPYFKKPGGGQRYADWKESKRKPQNSIFPQKGTDTPDLFINGNLVHNRIVVTVGNSIIKTDINSIISDKIKSKYGEELFKFNEYSLNYLCSQVRPLLQERINAALQ